MDKKVFGTALALVAAVISGFAIPLNKIFVVNADPTVFTAVRALIIGLVFLLIAETKAGFDFHKFRKFKACSWKPLIAIGVIGGGLAFLMYFTGLQLTTAGRAAFLHKTLPVYAGIFAAVFLKERIPKKHWYALLVMIIGTLMIYVSSTPLSAWCANPGLGDLLVIGATVLWAAESTIASKVMKKGESNIIVSFGRMFIGALVLFAAIVLLGKVDDLLAISTQQFTNMLISTGVLFGYVLFWFWSIKHISISRASALLLIAPVISLLAGYLWLSEPVQALQLVGSALILVGAFVVVKIRSGFVSGI